MTQRISYVPLEDMDGDMRTEMERCAREGTPRPESSAVRAHVPTVFWTFANAWERLFYEGVCDHELKELCRVYISQSIGCDYCGTQRSQKATEAGLEDQQYDELLNFEDSDRYADREKAALAYTKAIAWGPPEDGSDVEEMWQQLHRHFSEPELVELGCVIGLTLGQQRWIRLLGISHGDITMPPAGDNDPTHP